MPNSTARRPRALLSLVLAVLVAVIGVVTADTSADAAPANPAGVVVPQPCAVSLAYPAGSSAADVRDLFGQRYGFAMVGRYWTDPAYQSVVRIIWETTDALACTPFLADLRANHGTQLTLNASSLSGWKTGDYAITRSLSVSLDFPKLKTYVDKGDEGHVARLFVHEITHAYQVNRGSSPAYWTSFEAQYARLGQLGGYGWDATEVQAEVVGWYVARCAKGNPYTTRYQGYYDWAKTIFGGKEFGPPLGARLDCSQQVLPAAPAAPAATDAAAAPAAPPMQQAAPEANVGRLEPFDPVMGSLSVDDFPAALAAQR